MEKRRTCEGDANQANRDKCRLSSSWFEMAGKRWCFSTLASVCLSTVFMFITPTITGLTTCSQRAGAMVTKRTIVDDDYENDADFAVRQPSFPFYFLFAPQLGAPFRIFDGGADLPSLAAVAAWGRCNGRWWGGGGWTGVANLLPRDSLKVPEENVDGSFLARNLGKYCQGPYSSFVCTFDRCRLPCW